MYQLLNSPLLTDGEDSSSSEGGSKDDEASKDSISVPKKPKTPPSSPVPSTARSPPSKIDQTQPSVKEKPEAKVAVHKTRELYGKNEHCYVMDAKSVGNIGRYLNVSAELRLIFFMTKY